MQQVIQVWIAAELGVQLNNSDGDTQLMVSQYHVTVLNCISGNHSYHCNLKFAPICCLLNSLPYTLEQPKNINSKIGFQKFYSTLKLNAYYNTY